MCEKCPKEICKAIKQEKYTPYIFKGSALHIHPPCWRQGIDLFEVEGNEHLSTTKPYVTKKTLSEAIMYALELKDITIEDALRLTKLRSMI